MNFPIPSTAQEFLILLVPFVTLLLGLVFFLLPARLLNFMGLRALSGTPEAIGEGRSSFAGILIAVGLSCLLLQEPIALQPGLNFVLALGWTIAAIGRVMQMMFDGGWRKRIQVRFLLAAALAGIAWQSAEVPTFGCFEIGLVNCFPPRGLFSWVLNGMAAVSLAFGLIALFLPKLALRILKLENRMRHPFGVGEPRGTLAGFNVALGGTVLLMPQPVDFVVLMLAAAWLFAAFGRLVSMLLDRGFTLHNGVTAVLEGGAGILLLLLMFGIL